MKRLLSAVLALLAIGCGGPVAAPASTASQSSAASTEPAPFDFVLDDSLRPNQPSVTHPDGTTGAAGVYLDQNGVATELLVDELLVAPADEEELRGVLDRTGGRVVGTNAVPDAPRGSRIIVEDTFKRPTRYVVRVDASRFPLDSFKDDAAKRGLRGTYRISSEAAARLLALASHEQLLGTRVTPNFLYQPDAMLHRTRERPLPGNLSDDAFTRSEFKTQQPAASGNGSTVTAAWQFLAGRGVSKKVKLAVIDSGFWLDAQGNPFDDPTGPRTDLPFAPIQYDFNGADYFAGGMNLNLCTNGNPCPWHGNASISVAGGFVDNQGAMAGTGGQVVEPMLFNVQLTTDQVDWAVRTATAWKAEVVSMSFGGNCNSDCQDYRDGYGYYDTFAQARSAGIILVASAGNSILDVDANNTQPCRIAGVICVGALADDSNQAADFSNFGASVDIWAPTNIRAMANPSTFPGLAIAGGTSASAPFIAGIAAMAKSMNPALNSDTTRDLLLQTRVLPGSPDPKVTAYVDAKRVVVTAANGTIPSDSFEPNNTAASATPLAPGNTFDRTLGTTGDQDWYRITLSDYSAVYIEVEHMVGLGGIFFQLKPESAPGVPSGVIQQFSGTGFVWKAKTMAPGTYLIRMNSNTPQPYHIKYSMLPTGLEPDQFEYDDTYATAALPPSGEYEVNLHTNGDVDWYRFNVGNLGVLDGFAFDIPSADMPVSVSVYDGNGVFKSSYPAATKQKIKLGSGSWVVKVSGSQRGRYVFSAGKYRDQTFGGILVAIDRFWWLDPSGPIEGWLVDLRDGYAFNVTERTPYFRLTGENVHVKLVDAEGNVLAEGSKVRDERGTLLGEVIPLGRLRLGAQYQAVIEREALPTDPPSGATAPEGQLPALSYQVSVGY